MPVSDIAGQTCSVARTIGAIGDAWTLMLLRELFLGSRRFDDFQRHTGMPPQVLSQRLQRLLDDGIVERAPYRDRPVRHAYTLTAKGQALWPVLSALREWGDRWVRDAGPPPVRLVHRDCGGRVRLEHRCRRCGKSPGAHDVEVRMSSRARDEREARARRTSGPRDRP